MALGIFVLICKIHGLSTVEGTKHLPLMAYCLLAKLFFESDNPEHVCAHTFLVLPHPSSSSVLLIIIRSSCPGPGLLSNLRPCGEDHGWHDGWEANEVLWSEALQSSVCVVVTLTTTADTNSSHATQENCSLSLSLCRKSESISNRCSTCRASDL